MGLAAMTGDFFVVPAPAQLWRSGALAIFLKGAPLPPRCVRCNEPTRLMTKRRLHWHHPGLYLLLINILVYALVVLASRKSADVLIPLCMKHRAERRRALLAAWIGCPTGIAVCVYGMAVDNVAAGLAGLYTVLAAAVFGAVGARILSVVHIDAHLVRVRGLDPSWLRELPSWDAYPQAR
jgi:hypothetical protein